MSKVIIWAPIAKREIDFYIQSSKYIRTTNKEYDVKFISFYQLRNDIIIQNSFECYDIYKYLKYTDDISVSEIDTISSKFNISNLQKLLVHERVTFSIKDTEKLLKKFISYLKGIDLIFSEILEKYDAKDIIVLQELGGFIAPLSLFFVSRKYSINHIFFEPSFFNGRLYFVLNSLMAVNCSEAVNYSNINQNVVNYLKNTLIEKASAIPKKDKHHFMDMKFSKVFNFVNISKLSKKIYYKYIKKQTQEYEHIFNHVVRSLSMLINRKRNSFLYSKLDESRNSQKYIYFPFHVQLDYALTTRSPEYFNQLALVEYICQILPPNILLYTKEHPASVGGFRYSQLKSILDKYDNIKLIHPRTNSFNILDKAEAVVTINSKVGAEAIAADKKVIVLGNSFYSNSKLATFIDNIKDLEKAIVGVLNQPNIDRQGEIEKFFSYLWDISYPGQLYDTEPNNIKEFNFNLLKFINEIN